MNVATERVNAIMTRNPKCMSFVTYYKIKLTKSEIGQIEGEFVVDDGHMNPIGTLHGGVLASIADECSGLITYTLTEDKKFPTLNLNINYLRPASKGSLVTFVGKLIKQGSRVVYIEVEFSSEGKLIAKAACNHSVV